MNSKLQFSVAIILLVGVTGSLNLPVSHGDSSTPINRIFYLVSDPGTTTRKLDFRRPTGSCQLCNSNATGAAVEFVHNATIQVPTVFLSSPAIFSLWIGSNSSTTMNVTGTLVERKAQSAQGSLPVFNSTLPRVNIKKGLYDYNLTFPTDEQPLVPTTHISVSIRFATLPKDNMTLYWGSESTPAFVLLPLSGYEFFSAPMSILDRSSRATTSFDLNATAPNNIVFFEVSVSSAFGLADISRVNMTLLDPFSHPVRDASNLDMPFLQAVTIQPSIVPTYIFSTFWVYPSNATEGTYQVQVSISDAQGAIAFVNPTPATFGLSRTSILTRALNLIPYFGLGAGGLVVAAVAYRRTKTRKSYLVPFDFFNSLTGGELDGGSVVTVEGNTGSGKTLLTEQLMYEDLKKGRPCVFVSTGDFPSNVRTGMKSMGLDVTGYEQNGQLTFVDGYSSEAGQQSPEKFSIPALGDLTTVGMKISSSLPQESFKGGSLYFDSLTPLASKAKPESLVSFVQSVGARVKGMGGKAFFTMGPSVDTLVQKQLEEMADCVVQMEAFEEGGVRKSRLRVAKLRARRHQQGWIIYTIEEGRGIIFYSKKARS